MMLIRKNEGCNRIVGYYDSYSCVECNRIERRAVHTAYNKGKTEMLKLNEDATPEKIDLKIAEIFKSTKISSGSLRGMNIRKELENLRDYLIKN